MKEMLKWNYFKRVANFSRTKTSWKDELLTDGKFTYFYDENVAKRTAKIYTMISLELSLQNDAVTW